MSQAKLKGTTKQAVQVVDDVLDVVEPTPYDELDRNLLDDYENEIVVEDDDNTLPIDENVVDKEAQLEFWDDIDNEEDIPDMQPIGPIDHQKGQEIIQKYFESDVFEPKRSPVRSKSDRSVNSRSSSIVSNVFKQQRPKRKIFPVFDLAALKGYAWIFKIAVLGLLVTASVISGISYRKRPDPFLDINVEAKAAKEEMKRQHLYDAFTFFTCLICSILLFVHMVLYVTHFVEYTSHSIPWTSLDLASLVCINITILIAAFWSASGATKIIFIIAGFLIIPATCIALYRTWSKRPAQPSPEDNTWDASKRQAIDWSQKVVDKLRYWGR